MSLFSKDKHEIIESWSKKSTEWKNNKEKNDSSIVSREKICHFDEQASKSSCVYN